MKKVLMLLSGALFLFTLSGCGNKSKQKEITVYSAFEEEYTPDLIKAFNKKYPDIKINLIRGSSGIIAAKVKAEKNNPQADVLWGVAATSLLEELDSFQSVNYEVKNINSKFYDANNKSPKWVGITAWMTAFTYNSIEGENNSVAIPFSYSDLLKPEYKGKLIMPNPASSGTGFLTVSAWIQLMGEDKAWDYMDKLNENVEMYVHSGSAPTKMAAQGEVIVGIGMGFSSLLLEKKGSPIKTIFPSEGSGWEEEIVAVIKKEKTKPEAIIFANWAISEDAMNEYAKYRGFVTDRRVKSSLQGYPSDLDKQMIKNNLEWAAKNRNRILKEWEKRYGKQ